MSSAEQQVLKGQKVQHLLDDPTLAQAFDDLRTAIVEGWSKAPLRDVEGQHELKLMLKLVTDLRANLDRAIVDGKLAAIQIEQERKPTFVEKLRTFRKVM